MRSTHPRWRTGIWLVTVGVGLFLWGCPSPPPTPDSSLSPPTVGQPLYRCAEIIAFGGADRDATIVVYVNGTEVHRQATWLGWGAIKLPSALNAGDVVTAAQEVGGRISVPTREPVTAVNIPPSVAPERRLPAPEIVPPLYECQRVVRLRKTVPGAQVVARNADGDTYKGLTPYSSIRLGTPRMHTTHQWFNAMQDICPSGTYASPWSAKVTIQPKPATLPKPELRKPLVKGGDAVRVDNLVPGALVEITADDGSGPVRVGGGIAVEAATIFRIQPPLDDLAEYRATQALCELRSPPSDPGRPIPTAPTPSVRPPLCAGEYEVTVCDTALMSTVRVFVGTAQVAQAAGNGGCLTLVLGGTRTFATGDAVTARQEVAGTASGTSAVVAVTPDGAPPYDPGFWNGAAHLTKNNCYNYGCDMRTDTYAQPGQAHGTSLGSANLNCTDVGNAAQADGLATVAEQQKCGGCTHRVALVIDPGTDYHWYRLDDTGRWSHKPGPTAATNFDAAGNPITNPETANRTYVGPSYTLDYRVFCGYYCVDKDVVVIQ